MQCKCQYFTLKDGVLVCSVCGRSAPSKTKIEDKILDKSEFKDKSAPKSKRR